MSFIPLTCPNCNGKIEYKGHKTFKCPFCETELLLKENNVYYVDQTVHHHYGSDSKDKPPAPTKLLIAFAVLLIGAFSILLLSSQSTSTQSVKQAQSVREMPESEVLLSFARDIFEKGSAQVDKEDLAQLRYLSISHENDQWRFTYSLDDPFTNEQARLNTYVTKDKQLNKQRIDQKDFEAFGGLAVLHFNNTYEVSQGNGVSFAHMKQLKSYGGAFNESFSRFADSFGEKSRIVELHTQIRSNTELELLRSFPQLKTLAITYASDEVTDFHLLNDLPLHTLSVTFLDDLQWLSSLTGLQSLSIHHSDATDFTFMYALTQLTNLKFSYVSNLKTIDFVKNMPKLQAFEVDSAGIISLEPLAEKASLTKLHIGYLSNLASLDFINSLTSLKSLTLRSYYGQSDAWKLPHVTQLEVPGDFVSTLQAPSLTSLSITGGRRAVSGDDLSQFDKLVELKMMDIDEMVQMERLDQLKSLRTLQLEDMYLGDQTSALFNLKNITNLSCVDCRLTIDTGETISNTALTHLTLNDLSFRMDNEWVKDMELVMPYFSGLSGIRYFELQDAVLQSLDFTRNWQQLEELHIENNAVTSVEPLIQLSNLRKLYITGNPIQNTSMLNDKVQIY